MTERETGAFVEAAISAALLVALLVSLVQFFVWFGRGGLGVGRFAYLPAGIALAALYAAWRLRRALGKYRDAGTRAAGRR